MLCGNDLLERIFGKYKHCSVNNLEEQCHFNEASLLGEKNEGNEKVISGLLLCE